MDLSPEDDLRLNVLLANDVHAIRIDESKHHLYALTAAGETTLKLNPNSRPERYLKNVRELLSSHFLDSPAGYPIYLRRWTRMGDISANNLENLLKIGEPEAVIAVVRSPQLTENLAARAWWAMPNSENARRMLECPAVATADIARELADFLIEFLPYEEKPDDMIESVRLVLAADLADLETRKRLWKAGARKAAIRVGFLLGAPDKLVDLVDTPWPERHPCADSALPEEYAAQLARTNTESGQAFIHSTREIIKQLNNPETVCALLDAIGGYFSVGSAVEKPTDIEILEASANRAADSLTADEEMQRDVNALLFLAGISNTLATPVFSKSDAVGRVMRRQLEPLTSLIDRHLAQLVS